MFRRALISVWDKTGLGKLIQVLAKMNAEIIASEGTAKSLRDLGYNAITVSEYSGIAEMPDGLIKTLNAAVHAGILGDMNNAEHVRYLEELGVKPIDLVVSNLYPFEKVAASRASMQEVIDNIDIGGSALIRAAAKASLRYNRVVVLTNPNQYDEIIAELEKTGKVSGETRKRFAIAAFAVSAKYENDIRNYLVRMGRMEDLSSMYRTVLPENLPEELKIIMDDSDVGLEKVQSLRYGTNPHQQAAFYRPKRGIATIGDLKELKSGKEGLSQTNLEDMDHAIAIVKFFKQPACAIMKHLNPSGVAAARPRDLLRDVFVRARDCDPKAAYGGVIGFNCEVNEDTAKEICKNFFECIVATGFSQEALNVFEQKPDLRVVQVPGIDKLPKFTSDKINRYEFTMLGDGSCILSEPYLTKVKTKFDMLAVTKRKPTEQELRDMLFAWYVCGNVRSNTVIIVKDGATLGIGTGQQDRITALKLAIDRAVEHGHSLTGSVIASDGFFPFRDSINLAAKHGIAAIVQPGGGKRDPEVIAACNEYGIAMAFTGERCFAHF
jgi:phosphoribosylaminoimidazolecarboxamide formyltransferase/IMP cyclohydrolase